MTASDVPLTELSARALLQRLADDDIRERTLWLLFCWPVVAAVMMYAANNEHQSLFEWGELGAGLLFIKSIQLFRAERRRQPTRVAPPATKAIGTSAATAARRVYDVVTAPIDAEAFAPRGPRSASEQNMLLAELAALRLHAAHFAIFTTLDDDEVVRDEVLNALIGCATSDRRFVVPDGSFFSLLKRRMTAYSGAMDALSTEGLSRLPPEISEGAWSGSPPRDVGRVFAFYTGSVGDPVVQLAVAALWSATDAGTRNVFAA